MMTEMKLPACYAVIDENEMTYLDGGASSIINNINVIYKSVVELNNLLGGFIKK